MSITKFSKHTRNESSSSSISGGTQPKQGYIKTPKQIAKRKRFVKRKRNEFINENENVFQKENDF